MIRQTKNVYRINSTPGLLLRYFLSLLLILIISEAASAQGKTLAFNQVLLITTSQQTVPAGRVWKIESCMGLPTTSSGQSYMSLSFPSRHNIVINGTNIGVASETSVAAGGSTYSGGDYYKVWAMNENCTTMPIWLPAGTTLAAGTNVSYISVIEFEVIIP
jgi:hypothetical protein